MATRRMVFVLGLLCLAVADGRAATAAAIERILPFTPTADTLRVEIALDNDDADRGNVRLTGRLRPAGQEAVVWSGPLSVGTTLLKDLPVRAWSPGSPNLYNLTVTAHERGKRPATKTVRFGFRQIESRNGKIYLNGQPIFLRGLAINPPNRTVPEKLGHSRQFAYDYVKYLRGQNVNLIRLEPADQDWLDVCDELGMMVYQGFYGSPPTGLSKEEEARQRKLAAQDEAIGKRLPPNFQASMAAYQKEFETYVHHPSVIIYVLSNEMPYKGEAGELVHDFLSRAHAHLSKWDATRLYIGNAGYGAGREGDINDVHRYWGWYYNSFTTYYNLRDGTLFGDPAKNQPFTFSECVGSFTGPTGAWNYIERKQLAAGLGWTGHSADQPRDAQAYQAFMNKQAIEIFRRMRAINGRISGIMPFTIAFHNWRGIESFDQMKPTAAAEQFATSYNPVLLSFEHWQPNVYAGATTPVYVHVVNDADDFRDLREMLLEWKLIDADGRSAAWGQMEIPPVEYYGTWRGRIDLTPAAEAREGEYRLIGQLKHRGETLATNDTPIFIAPKSSVKPAMNINRSIAVIGDATANALNDLGIAGRPANLSRLDAKRDLLVIGEEAWDQQFVAATPQLRDFVKRGGRILLLGQSYERFDPAWLPSQVKMLATSVNDPGYFTVDRPAADQTHVNPLRPAHPIFTGVDRRRLQLWSDYTNWDETKSGFPRISPMRFGFQLTDQNDLKHTAILADYDAGLAGVALAEMFDGDGSILLCGLDLIGRIGIDPVADKLLLNLVSYMAGDAPHERHPRITETIRWGDFPTEHGVIGGPIFGLFRNTDWVQPPTAPNAEPLTDAQGAWNTKPGDQFLPNGIRPRGPFYYTFNCAPREVDRISESGTGIFYATIPGGRSHVVTKVKNATAESAPLRIDVNDVPGKTITVPSGKTITIRTPLPSPGGVTDVGVRYTGGKELIIRETSFE